MARRLRRASASSSSCISGGRAARKSGSKVSVSSVSGVRSLLLRFETKFDWMRPLELECEEVLANLGGRPRPLFLIGVGGLRVVVVVKVRILRGDCGRRDCAWEGGCWACL